MDCLLTCKPLHHLNSVTLLIWCSVSQLGEVNMQVFRCLRVEAICCTPWADWINIMFYIVDFFSIEMFPYLQILKDAFSFMESDPCPVQHWVVMEIPFLKCHRVGWHNIVWKLASISACPPMALCIAHLEMWSLNMLLCSWCNMSGVKQEMMSQCGKSFQNGLISLMLWGLNSLGARSCDCCARIWIIVSGSWRTEWISCPLSFGLTRQIRHAFSWQHAMRHCSG